MTKIINKAYWDSDSETKHSLLVGSYGRGTAIHLSDIDLLVELPENQKERFDNRSSNGQSALLQDIKKELQEHYTTSTIKADGQIVSIDFADSIRFEILPAFSIPNSGKFEYPDTHDGGTWLETNPKEEKRILTERNKTYKGIVKRFCRMQRAWNDKNNVNLHGIAIDTLIYNFFSTWSEEKTSYIYFDWLSRDFYKWLIDFVDSGQILFSFDYSYTIGLDKDLRSKSQTAYNRALKAIENAEKNSNAETEWRKIYGDNFPKLEETVSKDSHLNYVDNRYNMSTRTSRSNIGLAMDTEDFADEKWEVAIEQRVKIQTDLEMAGFRKGDIRKFFKIPIKANSKIYLSVDKIAGIDWYWKVRNVGEIANSKNMIRGQIKEGGLTIREPISFRGPHYVEVYGVSNGTVKIFGRIEVPLEGGL